MSDETSTMRLSIRTTASNFKKLVAIARAKGWLNAKGQPNISRVLNHIIGEFDDAVLRRKGKKRG